MGGGFWAAQADPPLQWVGAHGLHKAAQLMALVALGVVLYFGSLVALGFPAAPFQALGNAVRLILSERPSERFQTAS